MALTSMSSTRGNVLSPNWWHKLPAWTISIHISTMIDVPGSNMLKCCGCLNNLRLICKKSEWHWWIHAVTPGYFPFVEMWGCFLDLQSRGSYSWKHLHPFHQTLLYQSWGDESPCYITMSLYLISLMYFNCINNYQCFSRRNSL